MSERSVEPRNVGLLHCRNIGRFWDCPLSGLLNWPSTSRLHPAAAKPIIQSNSSDAVAHPNGIGHLAATERGRNGLRAPQVRRVDVEIFQFQRQPIKRDLEAGAGSGTEFIAGER